MGAAPVSAQCAYFKLIIVRYGNIIQHFVLINEVMVILSMHLQNGKLF